VNFGIDYSAEALGDRNAWVHFCGQVAGHDLTWDDAVGENFEHRFIQHRGRIFPIGMDLFNLVRKTNAHKIWIRRSHPPEYIKTNTNLLCQPFCYSSFACFMDFFA
jgi:hypothetical protein